MPGRVLVVDDHEPSLLGLRQWLEATGYTVYAARNGTDALRLANRERPDLVLLDVIMPDLSGVDVCAGIKAGSESRFTPVVLISGSHDRDKRIAGLDAGADDFLNKPIDLQELHARVRSLIRLKRSTDDLESAEALLLTLGRIVEARDPSTEGHCERLSRYATALGAALGLDQADLDELHRGAFLHDIGKIGIPDRVLLKRTRLTRREQEVMRRHPAIGDALCATLRSLESVRPIVRHHHERHDGHGYPDGLSGDAIPLLARIVSVVDVFDALTTDRPYRQALPVADVYQMLTDNARGGWCDETLVGAFIDLHERGTLTPARAVGPRPEPAGDLAASP